MFLASFSLGWKRRGGDGLAPLMYEQSENGEMTTGGGGGGGGGGV